MKRCPKRVEGNNPHGVTVNEIQAYKGLASAILLSAISNIIRHQYVDRDFINSDWCQDLCEMAGIVHPQYIRKVRELILNYKATDWVIDHKF